MEGMADPANPSPRLTSGDRASGTGVLVVIELSPRCFSSRFGGRGAALSDDAESEDGVRGRSHVSSAPGRRDPGQGSSCSWC